MKFIGTFFDLCKKLIKNGGMESVTSLPTTNNFEGREVNYKGTKYIYYNGAWVNQRDAKKLGGLDNSLYISNPKETVIGESSYEIYGESSLSSKSYIDNLYSPLMFASPDNFTVEYSDDGEIFTEIEKTDPIYNIRFYNNSSFYIKFTTHPYYRITVPYNNNVGLNGTFYAFAMTGWNFHIDNCLIEELQGETWNKIAEESFTSYIPRIGVVEFKSHSLYQTINDYYCQAIRITLLGRNLDNSPSYGIYGIALFINSLFPSSIRNFFKSSNGILSTPLSFTSQETLNYDANNIKPTQTGTVKKSSSWIWQYLVQSVNWLRDRAFNVINCTNISTTTFRMPLYKVFEISNYVSGQLHLNIDFYTRIPHSQYAVLWVKNFDIYLSTKTSRNLAQITCNCVDGSHRPFDTKVYFVKDPVTNNISMFFTGTFNALDNLSIQVNSKSGSSTLLNAIQFPLSQIEGQTYETALDYFEQNNWELLKSLSNTESVVNYFESSVFDKVKIYGGTATQFLKADGSVDEKEYIDTSFYNHGRIKAGQNLNDFYKDGVYEVVPTALNNPAQQYGILRVLPYIYLDGSQRTNYEAQLFYNTFENGYDVYYRYKNYNSGGWQPWIKLPTKVDDVLSDTSKNPVQNKVVTQKINSHTHDGTDTPKIDYNDLENKPTIYTSATINGVNVDFSADNNNLPSYITFNNVLYPFRFTGTAFQIYRNDVWVDILNIGNLLTDGSGVITTDNVDWWFDPTIREYYIEQSVIVSLLTKKFPLGKPTTIDWSNVVINTGGLSISLTGGKSTALLAQLKENLSNVFGGEGFNFYTEYDIAAMIDSGVGFKLKIELNRYTDSNGNNVNDVIVECYQIWR